MPASPSQNVVVQAHAEGGFSKAIDLVFSILPPTPRVRMLSYAAGESCYHDLSGGDALLDPPVALCPHDGSPDLRVGVDAFTVLVDFPDDHFATAGAIPASTISLVLDGELVAAALTPRSFLDGDGRGYLLVDGKPPRVAADVRVRATVTGGFVGERATLARFVAPAPHLEIVGCPTDGCPVVAGVGQATAVVTAPGPSVRTVVLRTYVANVLQPGTISVMTMPAGDHCGRSSRSRCRPRPRARCGGSRPTSTASATCRPRST